MYFVLVLQYVSFRPWVVHDDQQGIHLIILLVTTRWVAALMGYRGTILYSYKIVPPSVTDGSTGLVYCNKFCTRCNGLQQSKQISWSIELWCQDIVFINREGEVQTNLTLHELVTFCSVNHYKHPSSLSNLRGCKRLLTGLITTCPEDSPMDLRENCTAFGLNLVTFGKSVYILCSLLERT